MKFKLNKQMSTVILRCRRAHSFLVESPSQLRLGPLAPRASPITSWPIFLTIRWCKMVLPIMELSSTGNAGIAIWYTRSCCHYSRSQQPRLTQSAVLMGNVAFVNGVNCPYTAMFEVTAPTRKSVCRPQEYFPEHDFRAESRKKAWMELLLN